MMEHFSNEIILVVLCSAAAFCVLVILIIFLSIQSCFSVTSRGGSFKYMLLNAKPEIPGQKELLCNKAGLNTSDVKVDFRMDKIFIEAKHKLTNPQWRECERFDGHRMILVHQIAKTKVEISENFKDEIKHGIYDGLKIKYPSKFCRVKSENYERVQIEGNWLNITLLLDSLNKSNYVETEQDQGFFSLEIADESNKPLLNKESHKQNKSKKEQISNIVQENSASTHCNRNKRETAVIENQLYDYVLEHRKEHWQRIISPKPFNWSYESGSLVLTGQECMVSKAAEDLANLFQSLTAELSESTYLVSDGISVEAFKAEANLRIAVPMKTLMKQQNRHSFKLFGPRDNLAKVKEMLKNLDKELRIPSNQVQPAIINDSCLPAANKMISNDDRFSNQQSQLNTDSSVKKARHGGEIPALVSENSQQSIKVSVFKGDLTQQDTDVIVNPANESLQHGGGAAKAIATAAGRRLVDECREYIRSKGRLQVGQVMHTTAGDLWPRIKFVIHAVGPSANRCPDERSQEKIVQETFFTCYKYANDRLNAVSISIPAISSGILGIHKDIVARSAFTALTRFKEERSNVKRTLEKVNFVNIDDESTQAFLNVFEGKQSDRTKMKSLQTNGYPKEAKRDSTSSGQPKRIRVLLQKQSSSICDQNSPEYEVNKSSKLLLNFEKVGPSNVLAPTNDDSEDSMEDSEDCVICMDSITDPEVLPCGHKFCKSCIKRSFETFQPKCPSCGRLFGLMRGNQPQGTMTLSASPRSLSGYEQYKTIVMQYDIPSGIQDERHPNPGQPYHGTQRQAYLPDNAEGREVSELLRKAFDADLIFTVGRSSTTGQDNQVIWNDIHHKTSETGPYGYPDQLYLSRVKEELKAKGIVCTTAIDTKFSLKQTMI